MLPCPPPNSVCTCHRPLCVGACTARSGDGEESIQTITVRPASDTDEMKLTSYLELNVKAIVSEDKAAPTPVAHDTPLSEAAEQRLMKLGHRLTLGMIEPMALLDSMQLYSRTAGVRAAGRGGQLVACGYAGVFDPLCPRACSFLFLTLSSYCPCIAMQPDCFMVSGPPDAPVVRLRELGQVRSSSGTGAHTQLKPTPYQPYVRACGVNNGGGFMDQVRSFHLCSHELLP